MNHHAAQFPLTFTEEPDLPVSTIQAGILAEQWGEPHSTRYNVSLAYKIDGKLDRLVIGQAVDWLVRHHEILRTVYHDGMDGPVQAIADNISGVMNVMQAQDENDLSALIALQTAHVFDLTCELPIRVTLIQVSEGQSQIIFVFHHIAVDGASIRLIVSQLGKAYECLRDGRSPDIDLPDLQYADWAAWQQERLARPEADQLLERALANLESLPDESGFLPRTAPDDADKSQNDACLIAFDLDYAHTSRAEARARSLGLSPFVLFAGAFALTLSRLGTNDRFALAMPVTLRDRNELNNTVGCFVNSAVFIANAEAPIGRQLFLQRLRDSIVNAIDTREVPFETLMRRIAEKRGEATSPVRIMFTFDDAVVMAPDISQLVFTPLPCDNGSGKFDITLSLVRGIDRIRVGLDFALGVLSPQLAATVPALLSTAIDWLSQEQDAPLSAYAAIEPEVTQTRIAQGIGEKRTVASGTLDAHIFSVAERVPNTTALIAPDGEISFHQLQREAQTLADRFARLGIGNNDRILIAMPRSLGLMIGMLGSLRAGAAYIPADPLAPKSRLLDIIEDAQPAAVLYSTTQGGDIRDIAVPAQTSILIWDGQRFEVAKAANRTATVPRPSQEHDLAYMIYTSGSTGKPKGVMVPHCSLMNYLQWAVDAYDIEKYNGTSVVTATAFDATLLSFWGPLICGQPVHLPGEDESLPKLADQLAAQANYSFVKITPAHMDLLAELQPIANQSEGTAAFVIGGEALTAAAVAPWRKHAGNIRLINEYGPTETVVGCAVYEVRDSDPATGHVPIGKAIWNTQLYVLNRFLEPVLPGETGELFIGGAGVAWGYWNRPAMTAERFLADPFSGRAGGRMYSTGDLVRMNAEGQLEFLGRSDDQIKLRGYRIEPGEIEAALRSLAGVEKAAVILAGEGETKRLVAFVTGSVEISALRDQLGLTLPPYMLPDEIYRHSALPLTPNGKIDRKRLLVTLADVQPTRPARASDSDAYIEQFSHLPALIALWQGVLARPDAHATTHFFKSGGNSLAAIRLLARLKRQFSSTVTYAELFHAPTPLKLAALLANKIQDTTAVPEGLSDVSRQKDDASLAEPVPSPAEIQLWLEHRLGGETSAYVMQTALALRPDQTFDLAELSSQLSARHAILRTAYPQGDNGPLIRILPAHKADLREIQLEDRLDPQRDAPAAARRDAALAFNLDTGNCWRMTHIRDRQGNSILILSFHHIITDGITLVLLTRDVLDLIDGKTRAPVLKDYRHFAALRAARLSVMADRQSKWWTSKFTPLPDELKLPSDRPLQGKSRAVGAIVHFEIEATLSQTLAANARAMGGTLHSLIVTAYALLFQRLSGQHDIVIGIPISERPEEYDEVAGLFLNTLPLRIHIDEKAAAHDLMTQVMIGMTDALSHADLPLTKIIEAVNPPRWAGRMPLLHTILDWREETVNSTAEPSPHLIHLPVTTAPFDLAASLMHRADGTILGGFIYDANLLDQETISVWCRSFVQILNELAVHPSTPSYLLNVVAEQDRPLAILRGADPGPVPDLSALLLDAMQKYGDCLALDWGANGLSYAEVLTRAQALTFADTPVARISDEDPAERIIKALAALLADKVFALEDPSLPEIRKHQMGQSLSQIPRNSGGAYIQFTSGSTGTPKGALLSRTGLANLALSIGRALNISPGKRVLQLASPAFDAWIWEVFTTLANGGTLVLAERADLLAGEPLAHTLRHRHVSHVTITPSALAAMGNAILPELTTIVAAGEVLSSDVAHLWGKSRRLINAYGPCEATICTTFGDYGSGTPTLPDIGTPMDGAVIAMTDPHGQLTIPGAAGEISIGGLGVGLGYIGDKENRGKNFGFSEILGGASYKSGDMARIRPALKRIQFLGRNDRQVKIRGVRIELDEVETALQQSDGVVLAAVRPVQDVNGLRALAGWVTGPAAANTTALRAVLAQKLPETMLPAFLIGLEAMPLTVTGKIDRSALTLDLSAAQELDPQDSPASADETRVLTIFKDILALAKLPGKHQSFFTLGGHSLLAVRLAARLSAEFGHRISLPELLAHPTAAQMAALAATAHPTSACMFSTLREGEGAPAFLVHSIDGSGLVYRALAAQWKGTRPVIVLEQGSAFASLADQASAYADELCRRAPPHEPLYLAGWSLGAMIAAALTQVLLERGRDVRLVLIDSAEPSTSTEDRSAIEAELVQEGRRLGADAQFIEQMRRNIQNAQSHRFTPQACGAGIIRALDSVRDSSAPADLGWAQIFTPVKIGWVAGDHHAVIRSGDLSHLSETIESLWARPGESPLW
jgi:amino acid adenylation domain-containing protein